jgi:segregation and condensation protein B
MDENEIKYFLEAALLAAGRPLNIDQLQGLFDGRMAPEKTEIRKAIETLNNEYEKRGIVVSEVASGFRMQVKSSMADRLEKLWEERPPRYSRALFETLALIAYRQPITRGEIEEIRGVSVSSNITRQLLEREWVRVVGHRDVPGRPAMFGTTKGFLDYFSLKKLDDLPPLADLSDWESLRVQLNLPDVEGRDGAGPDVGVDVNAEVDDGSESAANEASDLPVLYPEGAEEPVVDDATLEEAPREEDGPGEEQPEDEELAVSEWPQPVG